MRSGRKRPLILALFGDADHAFADVVAVEEADEGGGGVFEAVDDVFFDF